MFAADANVLLILATVLVVGVSFGSLAKSLHLPSITGQILAGIAIGSSGLHLFDHTSVDALYPVTNFALSLMAVTIGAHLNFRKLRNAGKRLVLLAALESTVIPGVVVLALSPFEMIDWSFALLLGTLAISTAPATIIALVNETRSKGVLVNTMVAGVALNNMSCLVLFEMARFVARDHLSAEDVPFRDLVFPALLQVFNAASIGAVVAVAVRLLSRLSHNPQWMATKGLIAILITSGVADFTDASPLLACLFLGIAQVNLTRKRELMVDVPFSHFSPVILAAFFTIAGMELTLQYAWKAGVVALVFFLARGTGKVVAAYLAMRLAGATERVRRYLGTALIPQAGVAVGLVVMIEKDPIFSTVAPEMLQWFIAIVLTTVVGNELVGPILTRMSLKRSGDFQSDRTRLIDFIQEDNIVTNLTATNVEDAIRQLSDVLARSHGLSATARDAVLESALERERHTSTSLGEGLAIPHATLTEGDELVGVMGLSSEGLDFETRDGRPVHCIVLLATPENQRERHLEVLAALARTVGTDPQVQELLFHAETAAHAYEILTSEHAAGLNYFLDDL